MSKRQSTETFFSSYDMAGTLPFLGPKVKMSPMFLHSFNYYVPFLRNGYSNRRSVLQLVSYYVHYQGRGSLYKIKRFNELCKLLNDTPLRGMDVSESSNNSKSDEIFYMMKYDTRVEGPCDNNTWKEPAYIPKQFIIDTTGNNGKSTVASLA